MDINTHLAPGPLLGPVPWGGGTKFKFVPPVAEPLWKTLCIRCTKTVRSKQSRWEKGGVRQVLITLIYLVSTRPTTVVGYVSPILRNLAVIAKVSASPSEGISFRCNKKLTF